MSPSSSIRPVRSAGLWCLMIVLWGNNGNDRLNHQWSCMGLTSPPVLSHYRLSSTRRSNTKIHNIGSLPSLSSTTTVSSTSRLFLADGEDYNSNSDDDDDDDEGGISGVTTTATTSSPPPLTPAVQTQSQTQRPVDCYIDSQYASYADGVKPDSSWVLAWTNFQRQGSSIIEQLVEVVSLKGRDAYMARPPGCLGLKLSNEAVMEAEKRRIERGGGVDAHPVSQALYDAGCLLLDRLFDGRPIERFWFLEIIARIPYFVYVSMLHLYESFGWFRAVELRKVHAAEDWNELHHLLIMESLGGNSRWSDRFLGYHVAFAYYWLLVVVYLGSPRVAYQFMELLEAHAVDTYTTFVRENRDRLAQLPPPYVATSYYKTGDLYMFDDFQVSRVPGSRRPPCDTLLDVFTNIAIDEGEHVKTMQACQDYALFGIQVVSPHLMDSTTVGSINGNRGGRTDVEEQEEAATMAASAEEAKRKMWKEWSERINEELNGTH